MWTVIILVSIYTSFGLALIITKTVGGQFLWVLLGSYLLVSGLAMIAGVIMDDAVIRIKRR
jgi:hypothetical protein